MNAKKSAVLSVHGLVKHFRGVIATDRTDLKFSVGELHALIGPNGAGKTTLINLLAGELQPSQGHIFFEGQEITRLSVHERAQRGLVRSYQITSVFPPFSALQNVMLAVQAREGHSFSFFRDTRQDQRLISPARDALELVGLAGEADSRVHTLAHGARRQLELAMVLALEPRIMLLDEPLAGMSGAEADEMVALLARLKGHYTIVLVEHDMDAVFSLADRLTVLVAGRPIASGSPDAMRGDKSVREAYLGDGQGAM
ncbi:MAG: ABC transporter ATP-binding protein [Burkholderiaceae bacterium]|nr:ABC transporter ATP-binding protein [Burkholderiaceae bacterium]